jgi:hypothetical protein
VPPSCQWAASPQADAPRPHIRCDQEMDRTGRLALMMEPVTISPWQVRRRGGDMPRGLEPLACIRRPTAALIALARPVSLAAWAKQAGDLLLGAGTSICRKVAQQVHHRIGHIHSEPIANARIYKPMGAACGPPRPTSSTPVCPQAALSVGRMTARPSAVSLEFSPLSSSARAERRRSAPVLGDGRSRRR